MRNDINNCYAQVFADIIDEFANFVDVIYVRGL